MDEERELDSDSTLLYPTAESDEREAPDVEEEPETRYLFPLSEFEPDEDETRTSSRPTNGELVRDSIVRDMISLIINRTVPKSRPEPPEMTKPRTYPLLTRDEIISKAMEEAYRARRAKNPRDNRKPQLDTLLSRPFNFNRKSKVPPIKVVDNPDIHELVRRGRLEGYSEAAIIKTRRDNNTRRLFVPSKEENDTVDLWRLEEKYRTSITKLQEYTK